MLPVACPLPIALSLHPVILNEVKDLQFKKSFADAQDDVAHAQNEGATVHGGKTILLVV